MGREAGVSIFMSLLTGLIAVLNYYRPQDEMLIGTLAANRTQVEHDRIVGLFMNTLVLRTPVPRDKTFRTLLSSVRDATLEAFDHQVFPFDTLIESLARRSSAEGRVFP